MYRFTVETLQKGEWAKVHEYESTSADGAFANLHMHRRDGIPVRILIDGNPYYGDSYGSVLHYRPAWAPHPSGYDEEVS